VPRSAKRDGLVEAGILPAGNVSGAITGLIDVADFIPAMVRDAIAVLESLTSRIVLRPGQPERS
jgi:hypothetical protein